MAETTFLYYLDGSIPGSTKMTLKNTDIAKFLLVPMSLSVVWFCSVLFVEAFEEKHRNGMGLMDALDVYVVCRIK